LSVGLFANRGIKTGTPCQDYSCRCSDAYAGAGLTDGRGLFFGGGIKLLLIQMLAILVSAAWSVAMTWCIVEDMKRAGLQLRPPEGHEEHGIDFVSHGENIRVLRGYGALEHEAGV